MEELSTEYVAQGTLPVSYWKPWLADEGDVDAYFTALREALLGAIKSGKRADLAGCGPGAAGWSVASTIQVIAGLLQADEQEAERFLREVQGHLEGGIPEDALIVQVLREHRTDNLTPEEVALIAKTKGERGASSKSGPVRNKCPHGVPIGQRCHSCERNNRPVR